ncbi:hypothetical protein RHSIM_Rhsim12G0115500 [Rhododendron simsii]|uniref:Uncharacterized protein n=1 Tax=Rhododendron simsii TaxID=118357 RepID=A0A834G528_RHOSS|nr:hypothetical protein RHSIM_Rhsim12G0115500 [Rhododendron simsii]
MAGSTTTITRQLGPSALPTTTTTATTTLTLDPSSPSPSSSQPREILTMELKKKNKKKKVTWKEGTVDNEFLQKKSSKKCCIFHKDKPFDDDDSDDDDDDFRRPDEDHGRGHDQGDGCCSSGGGGKIVEVRRFDRLMVTKSDGSSTLVFFLLINAVLVSTLRKGVVGCGFCSYLCISRGCIEEVRPKEYAKDSLHSRRQCEKQAVPASGFAPGSSESLFNTSSSS